MKLYFTENGSGTPLILLHGFPFDHTIWNVVQENLRDISRVILPDLRGAGNSKVEQSKFTMHDMAIDVVEMLDALSIEQIFIAGHSMGGYVALEFAQRFPDRVLGIALVASHIYADTPEKKNGRIEMIGRIRREGPANVFAEMPLVLSKTRNVQLRCRTYIDTADAKGAMGSLFAMAERQSYESYWMKSDLPKYVIAGEEDQLISRETSEQMANQSKNCNLVVIKGAGHMPMMEKSAAVSAALNAFIGA